jgi:hypothetical protein
MSDIENNDPLPGHSAFKELRSPITGEINPDAIQYTEPNGTLWNFVPRGHRYFELYERWLAAGNTAVPADPIPGAGAAR